MHQVVRLGIPLLFAAGLLCSCSDDEPVTPPPGPDGPTCEAVDWELLLTSDAEKLSDYNLFADAADPTSGPNDTGLPYDLNTELFTDYASKYRFVFIPCGEAAQYTVDETFVFPVGTAITKTFAMPADTGQRGVANETIIETRVMIKRESGWVTLPYVWLPDGTDAVLDEDGSTLPMSVVHDGTQRDFTYAVPSRTDCLSCHMFDGDVAPIGPKARNLNGEIDLGKGLENQLAHWRDTGRLEGLPEDLGGIDTMPVFDDTTDPTLLPDEAARDRYAKAYLDINCAHCHRPEGAFGARTPYYEFWREIEKGVPENDHGLCRTITPGNPAGSGVTSMMRFGIMPRIGTSLVHDEGLVLIEHWIAEMTYSCP